MISSWADMPGEVLLQTFSYLESHDVRQCQLACRKWSKASQAAVYRDVKLHNIAKATSFVHTIVSAPTLPGNHVKKLDLNNVFTPSLKVWDSLDLFTKLVVHCPNVKEVLLSKPFRSFWVRLMHERYEGRWKSLASVPYPIEDTQIEYYNFAVLSMRDTINNILLCDQLSYSAANNIYKAEYNALERRLKEFKNLQTLKMKTHTNKCLPEFDDMIDGCTDLEDLDMALFALEPYSPSNGDQQIDLEKIKKNKKVHRLHIDTVLNSDIVFIYMYTKFSMLRKLEVNTTCDKRTLQLMKRSKITITDENLENFISLLTNTPEYTIENLYIENLERVLIAILDQKTDGELQINYVDDDPVQQLPSTRLNLYRKGSRYRTSATVLFSANDRTPVLHQNQLLNEIGGALKSLIIRMEQKTDHIRAIQNPGYLNMLNGFYLDHIFRTCPSLNYLKVDGGNFLTCDPVAGINESIESLDLFGCSFYGPVFSQLSVRLPVLKTLVVNGYGCLTHDGKGGTFQNRFYFDMPYNSFDKVWYRTGCECKEGFFHLKICTMTGEKYFKGTKDGLQTVTAQAFNAVHSRKTTETFHIRCKSIKMFAFSAKNLSKSFSIP